jgi:glycosyltransferase involved in cell wall biosynthesis
MEKKLLSAYELAQKRIIVSNYRERLEWQEKLNKQKMEEIDAFYDDQEAKEYNNEAWVEKQSSKLYTNEEIEEHRKSKSNSITNINDNNEIIYESEEDMPEITNNIKEKLTQSDKPIELHWYGHFTSYSGFSRQNRAMVFGLSNKNVIVKTDMQPCSIDINEPTHNELKILSKREISSSAPKVYGATIPLSFSHGGKKILYTMMESSKTLHPNYVGKLNLFDEIWVPTNHGKELFKKNGVLPPIHIMPLGVDTDRYNSNAKPINFNFELNDFVFLSVFKWGYRKGYDILLRAFMEEFSSNDNVSLLICSRTDVNHKPEVISNDFMNIRSNISKSDEELPHIALYDKTIKEKDMPGIYALSNAFVLISRGEGFCLPIVEAGACGLPVIASNCSGHSDFLNHENSYLVDPDGYSTAKINGNMSKMAKQCGFYEDQMFPEFGSNAIEKTKQHMRFVYENYSNAQEKSIKLQNFVHNNLTWDMAVDKVYNRVKEISKGE